MAKRQTSLANDSPPRSRGTPRVERNELREKLLARLPVEERRVSLNGISTAVLEGGEGTPIVLLHGPVQYAAAWSGVIPDLVKTHHVIAPDLPAHGASGTFDGPAGIDLMVGWLDDLIECTCASPPVLVGQTLSGAIAAHFASDRGDRLSALVLVGAFGLAGFQPTPELGQALNAFLADSNEHTHDALWSRCTFDLSALQARLGDHWNWRKAYTLDRVGVPALRAGQHSLIEHFGPPPIPPEKLARINVPTVLVWGRQDPATPLEVAQSASASYGWPLHVIDEAGDGPPEEQPEAFLEVLHSALETLATKEGRP